MPFFQRQQEAAAEAGLFIVDDQVDQRVAAGFGLGGRETPAAFECPSGFGFVLDLEQPREAFEMVELGRRGGGLARPGSDSPAVDLAAVDALASRDSQPDGTSSVARPPASSMLPTCLPSRPPTSSTSRTDPIFSQPDRAVRGERVAS